MLRNAKFTDSQELHLNSDSHLMGKRYASFYKRIEDLWLEGKLEGPSGKRGIVPNGMTSEDYFSFDWRRNGETIRFLSPNLTLGATIAHWDCYQMFYKKEKSQFSSFVKEKKGAELGKRKGEKGLEF